MRIRQEEAGQPATQLVGDLMATKCSKNFEAMSSVAGLSRASSSAMESIVRRKLLFTFRANAVLGNSFSWFL
jgi:hypothetical protein